jgi:hypothetical protein
MNFIIIHVKYPHGSRWYNMYGESLTMTAISAAMSICMLMSCNPPRWVKYGQTKAWVTQEKATICINVDSKSLPETIEAVKAWDTAIGNWKHLIPIVGINEACNYIIEEIEAENNVSIQTLASTRLFGRRINLYKNRYELDILGVVLHEIGHVLGARHMAGTLMAPYVQPGMYRCPDAATVAQVAIANSVDPSLLLWCSNN